MGVDAHNASSFGLAEVLEALRHDLLSARANTAKDGGVGLGVDSAEIELSFTVEAAKDGKAGVNLKVLGVGFEGGGGATTSKSSVHRICITLKPLGDNPPPVAVAG